MCKVNGVQFICEARDHRRRTQNSGVMVHGGENDIDYYGVLHSVVELIYAEGMTVHLFKCRWFDTSPQSIRTDQYGIISVNTATHWYADDPFVFATAVKQVLYLDDLVYRGEWKVVNQVVHRNIYSATTLGDAAGEGDPAIDGEVDAYQEPNAVGIPESSTIRDNNVRHGRVVGCRREADVELLDVNPNEYNDDSDDEDQHLLPAIRSDTEEDSSGDSDYDPFG